MSVKYPANFVILGILQLFFVTSVYSQQSVSFCVKQGKVIAVSGSSCGSAGVSVKSNGNQGPAGSPGAKGKKGKQGNSGKPGQNGLAGLKGSKGSRGRNGDRGPKGNQGPEGIPGRGIHETFFTNGSIQGSGSGQFNAPGANGLPWTRLVTFSRPLGTPLVNSKALIGGFSKTELCYSDFFDSRDCLSFNQKQKPLENQNFEEFCPGSYNNPTAKPGYLCVYVERQGNNGDEAYHELEVKPVPCSPQTSQTCASNTGFKVQWNSLGGFGEIYINWAYTAPPNSR